MKYFNKIPLLLLSCSIGVNSFAATDWKELSANMPNAEYETVKADNSDLVEMHIARFPDNKIRFIGFSSYQNVEPAKVTIHSKKTDLSKICNDYQLYNKSFKAELTFKVNPINDAFNFSLKNGKKVSTQEFENPFTSSEAVAAPLSNDDSYPWTINSGDLSKLGNSSVSEWFTNFLNIGIKNRRGDKVTIDLSNYNGIACDLAAGYMRPLISKTITFEKSLPESSYWINQEQFQEVYKSFWLEKSKLNVENPTDARSTDLILLGWTLADKNADKEALFKNKSRAENLLTAIKSKNSNRSLDSIDSKAISKLWEQTFEYEIPVNNRLSTQNLMIQRGAVDVSITE